MSVANEFEILSVRYSPEMRRVWMTGSDRFHDTYDYEIYCKPINNLVIKSVFFNVSKKTMLLTMKKKFGHFGVVMPFWIENDLPVPSIDVYIGLRSMLTREIGDNFKEQYASHIIDNIINED